MSNEATFKLDNEYKDALANAIETNDIQFIVESMESARTADISILLDEFNSSDAKFVLDQLGPKVAGQVIIDLDEETQRNFLKIYESSEISAFLTHLESDDAADILNELPRKTRDEAISYLQDKSLVAHISELMHYDEDSAGGLMAKEYISANTNWTVKQCIEEIRRQAEKVDRIYSIYVVDDQGILKGKVSSKRLLLSQPETPITNILIDDITYVETYVEDKEVAYLMQKYDLAAIPVVNSQKKLVGRITIDDIVDVIQEDADENIQLISGISIDVEEDDSVYKLTKARLPWLIVGVLGGIFGALFMEHFEYLLDIELVFFIPLIMATGGNVGIQSSSIILQSLVNENVFNQSIFQRLLKALLVALVNGLLLAGLVFIGGWFFMETNLNVGIAVAASLFGVVLISSFMGTVTPIILHRLKINPALASGPFITTANDLIGLAIFLFTGHLLLS